MTWSYNRPRAQCCAEGREPDQDQCALRGDFHRCPKHDENSDQELIRVWMTQRHICHSATQRNQPLCSLKPNRPVGRTLEPDSFA